MVDFAEPLGLSSALAVGAPPQVAVYISFSGENVPSFLNSSGRLTAVGIASCLAFLASTVAASPLLVVEPASAVTPLADAPSASTAADAAAIAAQYGHPVVIASELTETTSLTAQPSGTTTWETSSEPVRVKDGNDWVDVDLTLEQGADGWVRPRASALPMQFAGGGVSDVARIQTETDKWVSEKWDLGALPRPRLDGATATYSDVLDDVDLKLTATPTGMTEVLVLNTPEAAANPELADLQLKVSGAALATGAEGSIVATAQDGSSITSTIPTWWDSSHPNANVEGPGGDLTANVLPHDTTASTLTLDVAAATTTPDVVYPIYIDPDWSMGASPFWMNDAYSPSTSYLNGQNANGNQSVGRGSDSRGTYTSRSFWRFNVGALAGKRIMSAQIALTQADSFNTCGGNVNIEAWRYSSGLSDGFSWNQDQANKGGWVQHLSSAAPCLSPGQSFGMDVSAGLAETSRTGAGSVVIGVRSGDENNGSGRRHLGQGATLRVDYNTTPNAPSGFTWASPPRSCGPTAAEASYMNGTQNLVMRINASDPDAGYNVQTTFRVVPANNGANTLKTFQGPMQAQGTVQVTIPANTFGEGAYAIQAQTFDGADTSGYSAYCFFTIKNSAPALPVLSGPASNVVGQPMNVTITPRSADQVRGFAYWWSPANKATPAPSMPTMGVINPSTSYNPCSFVQGVVTYVCATGSSTIISVAPIDETATLYVASYDKAGNVSVDTATKSNSAGLEVQATADPAAGLSNGHNWKVPSADEGALPDTLADRGPSPLTLTLGQGMNKAVTGEVRPGPPQAVLDYDNLVQLNRFSGGTHAARTGTGAPSGMKFESTMGQIFLPGKAPIPGNTLPIYSCALTWGDMTSTSAGCEKTGVTGVLLGYIWKTAAAAVSSGIPTRAVYRCVVPSSNDHFISHSATCEGQQTDMLLGYFSDVKPTKTASSDVDTTKSFSVSAWVNLEENNPNHNSSYTAVSQDGAANSGFYLQAAQGTWKFCLRSQTTTIVTDCAVGPAVLTSTWVYVTGIWDASNKQVRILTGTSMTPKDGTPVVSHILPAGDQSANGALVVGSAKGSGIATDMWFGQIYNPVITPGVISSSQLDIRYNDQLQ